MTFFFEEQLSSLVFFLCIAGLTVIENRKWNNLYTPFTLTAWPFVVITLLVNFLLYQIGFSMITARANYFVLLNLVFIWIFSYLVSHFNSTERIKNNLADAFSPYIRYKYIFIILSWVIIIFSFIRLLKFVGLHGGWWYIGTDEFGEKYFRGPVGHAIIYGKVCFLILYCISLLNRRRDNFLIYFTLFFLSLTIISIQNKYHLMIIVLMIFFISNLTKTTKQQIKSIVNVTLLLFMLFIVYFIIVALGWKTATFIQTGIWEHIFKMFLNYLVSGPIILDKWMDFADTKPEWTMFVPIINLFRYVSGNKNLINVIPYVSKGFYQVLKGFHSNVGTGFGVYYLIGGLGFTLMMTLFTSAISYTLYIKCKNFNNPILIFFNTMFLSFGVLSFFVQYYTILSIYEYSLMFFFTILILRVINKLFTINTYNNDN